MRLLTPLLLLLGCAPEPLPLPTAESIAALDRAAQPPLYQLLYDAPALPTAHHAQQRVRMLIWLRHMGLSAAQLRQLAALRATVQERQAQIVAAEQASAARWGPTETAIYDQIWEQMAAGVPLDAPSLEPLRGQLAALQRGGERERELLNLRANGIKAILEAEGEFIRSLSRDQEAKLADALFLLRNHLDPVGNPGDFRALVGPTYEPGQYGVLTRGLSEYAAEPLNIGGLWSDEPELTGKALHEAKKEVLLYLALLEPGMDDAIQAALALAQEERGPDAPAPPEPPTDPPPTDPAAPPPAPPPDPGE